MKLETIADAIRNLSALIANTDSSVDLVIKYLKDYEYVGSVKIQVPSDTILQCGVVTLQTINEDLIVQDTSEDFLGKYFVKKSEVFSNVKELIVESSNENESLLTQEYTKNNSIINSNNISTEYLIYNEELDIENRDYYTALPLSVIKELYGRVNTTINIEEISKWSINIKLGDITMYNKKNDFIVNGVNMKDSVIRARNISDLSKNININVVGDNYINKNGLVSKYAEIPDNAQHNMETIETLMEKDFKKSGDDLIIEFEEEQEEELVLNGVEDFFENGSIFDIITNNQNYFIQKRNLNATINKIVGKYKI